MSCLVLSFYKRTENCKIVHYQRLLKPDLIFNMTQNWKENYEIEMQSISIKTCLQQIIIILEEKWRKRNKLYIF